MKNFLVLLFTFISLSIFSQVEPAEAPMFGNVRGINSNYFYNFNNVNVTLTHIFKIENKLNTNIKITDIKLDEKITVTITDMIIKPKTTSYIYISVNPTILNKGKFVKKLIITTKQTDNNNILIIKTIPFIITGNVN